jgi:hypothetical protein
MPPQSRAQRRRQAAKQQQPRPIKPRPANQPQTSVVEPHVEPETETYTGISDSYRDISIANLGTTDVPHMPAPGASRATTNRSARRVRSARPAPEPVDYSKDYANVRRDLRWIAIWASLLFIAMIALRFSGLL